MSLDRAAISARLAVAMENEPDKSPSSGPPPPDLPPPPPPSMPPPPDLPPPPPPSSIPTTSEMPPPPPVERSAPAAKAVIDGDEDEDEVPGSDATFETRALAGLIDCFVAGAISWVMAKIHPSLGTLGWIGYMLVRDALPFLDGHSLGKRIMKIKAVTLEGKSLSGDWGTSVLRNLLLAIPFVNLIEVVVLFTRKDKGGTLRRLGDEWAKTKVVVAKEPSAL